LLALRRLPEAGAALDRYLAAGGTPSAELYRLRGMIHALLQEYLDAADAYRKALALKPGDTQLMLERARAYLIGDKGAQALAGYRAVLKIDADNLEAKVGLANARVLVAARGEGPAAAEAVEAALADARPLLRADLRDPKLQALTARVFALAADNVVNGPRGVTEAARRQDSALRLLRAALAATPEAGRAQFWMEIESDRAYAKLRRTDGFLKLRDEFGPGARPSAKAPPDRP